MIRQQGLRYLIIANANARAYEIMILPLVT